MQESKHIFWKDLVYLDFVGGFIMDIEKSRQKERDFSFSILVYAILSILMDRVRVTSYAHEGREESLMMSIIYGGGFFVLFLIVDKAITELYHYLPQKCQQSLFYQRPLASFNLLVCGVIGYFVARWGIEGLAKYGKAQDLEMSAFAGMAVPLAAFIPLVIIEKIIISVYLSRQKGRGK